MFALPKTPLVIGSAILSIALLPRLGLAQADNSAWQDDLNALPSSSWNYDKAAHLIERAGFGGDRKSVV